jgi:hypothetical protein
MVQRSIEPRYSTSDFIGLLGGVFAMSFAHNRLDSEKGSWSGRDLCDLDFDPVSIRELKFVSKPHLGGYFDNGSRMMADFLLVVVGTKDECPYAKNLASNDVHANIATVLVAFESNWIGR